MKKSFAKKILASAAIISVLCLSGISHAGGISGTQQDFTFDKIMLAASNYDVDTSTSTSTRKGGDGAACSSNDECSSNVCEGGSCCTNYGDPCDSTSHCCGHQSCGSDGRCPN
ncbi:MAG: hypothetical protein EG822_10270 [Deltaproteobacteria bacterium]|nr:hypothetical protein [Deltaproteobacteria bacterium]TLN04105.1 MAG: hypothetical protein FDZ73_05210 [bacterium]